MVYLFLSMYRNLLFYSFLVSELELFQSDIESVVSVYRAVQKLEIVLSNFCLGLFQSHQFHVIIFIHPFYNQTIIFISFMTILVFLHVIS